MKPHVSSLAMLTLAGVLGGCSALPSAGALAPVPAGQVAPQSLQSAATGSAATGSTAVGAPPSPTSTSTRSTAATSAVPATTAATSAPVANRAALAPTGSGTYSDKNGSFSYVYFVPHRRLAKYPVVLALHGCLENPTNFEAGTRWFEDAESHGYVVVMPQHLVGTGTDVNPNGCWQYWSDHYRISGEPEVLVGLLKDLGTRVPMDRTRMYVTGISSGAFMAVALAADYPDFFAAAASGSGGEYQPCVTDNVMQCYVALTEQQPDQDPTSSGQAAFRAAAGSGGKPIPVILFQGDADTVVAPFNLPQALTSIATMNDGIASYGAFPGTWNANATVHTTGSVSGGYTYDHYSADNGMLDWTIVHGMNHAWSGGVDDTASNASDGNNYDDPKGPNETVAFRTFLMRYHR
jgi:poly(hydroxyalkanoate) depolymerase family esterase